jgi:hypothetical protein
VSLLVKEKIMAFSLTAVVASYLLICGLLLFVALCAVFLAWLEAILA